MAIDRRRLLQALAALAALAALPAAAHAQPGGPMADFAAVSAALTGFDLPDAADVAAVWSAFGTPARAPELARLAALVAQTPAADLDPALRAAGLQGLAHDLVRAWFGGIVARGDGAPEVVLYSEALVWRAMSFTKPMGQCGGETGYWSRPPQGS